MKIPIPVKKHGNRYVPKSSVSTLRLVNKVLTEGRDFDNGEHDYMVYSPKEKGWIHFGKTISANEKEHMYLTAFVSFMYVMKDTGRWNTMTCVLSPSVPPTIEQMKKLCIEIYKDELKDLGDDLDLVYKVKLFPCTKEFNTEMLEAFARLDPNLPDMSYGWVHPEWQDPV